MLSKAVTRGVFIALIAGGALAHSGVMDATVMARMETMVAMQKQMKLLGQMSKGVTQFDPDTAQTALERIETLANETPETFEVPAEDPMSEARPLIWDEFSAFSQEAEALETLGATLVIESKADLAPAVRQLGQTCKSCHSKYRE
ncbi:cytochrome c [Celeribacter arenosi]|uniref:Cytochrome c556 n=1 Tax=Celeribacter arenosi TaxID=792649 RepID=A0ABP7KIX8_9RHOB